MIKKRKILFFANTDWYLYNFRLSLVKAIRDAGMDIVLVSPEGPYGRRLVEEGFRWIPLSMNRASINPWTEILTCAQLVRIYRQVKPDLVHHFTIKCVVYGTFAAWIAGIPYKINAIGGLGYLFLSQKIRTKIIRWFITLVLGILTRISRPIFTVQNNDDKVYLEKNFGISSGKVRVLRGSGIDTKKFKASDQNAKQQRKTFRVLCASRLLKEKGIYEYVQAAELLKTEGVDAEFMLAGWVDLGNPGSMCEEQIRQYHEKGVVNYLGRVRDIMEILPDVDVAVLASYREGIPRFLLEAAACEKPIVTTDVPGCRDIVEHGVNGLIIPPKDAGALAEAVRFVCLHREQCSTMGKKGREKILAEFDERGIIEKTLDVYKALLQGIPL